MNIFQTSKSIHNRYKINNLTINKATKKKYNIAIKKKYNKARRKKYNKARKKNRKSKLKRIRIKRRKRIVKSLFVRLNVCAKNCNCTQKILLYQPSVRLCLNKPLQILIIVAKWG